jgi:hypothetical protein
MKNLNDIQTIIVEQLLQRPEKMRDLAKLVILKNTKSITSQSLAERVVRYEIEQIRLTKQLEFDGKLLYICGTNDGYTIVEKDSKIFLDFTKRQLKRLKTCQSIVDSICKFNNDYINNENLLS